MAGNSLLRSSTLLPDRTNSGSAPSGDIFEAAARQFAGLLAEALIDALRPILQGAISVPAVKGEEVPAIMSVPEAARFLGVGRNTVYDAVRRGEIPSIRFGRQIRIPRHGLFKQFDLA